MKCRSQILVLEVFYEPDIDGFTQKSQPAEWDWPALVGEEAITVLASGPVEDVTE